MYVIKLQHHQLFKNQFGFFLVYGNPSAGNHGRVWDVLVELALMALTDPFPRYPFLALQRFVGKSRFFSSPLRFIYSVETLQGKFGITVVDGNLILISTDSAGFRISHFLWFPNLYKLLQVYRQQQWRWGGILKVSQVNAEDWKDPFRLSVVPR